VNNGFEVDLYDPGTDPAPEHWDTFVDAASIFPVWRWSVVRATASCGGRHTAAVIRDGSSPIALALVRLRRLGPLLVADIDPPGTSALPGLVFAGSTHGRLGRANLDPAMVRDVVAALESTLGDRYGRRLALVWFRQVFADMLPSIMTTTTLTYAGAPVTYLHNEFDSYAAYLRTLRKSRRVDQARLVRRLDEDPRLTIVHGPTPEGFDPAPFYRQSDETALRNHHQRFPPLRIQPRAVRDALVFDTSALLLRYVDCGELIGCALTVDNAIMPLSSAWGALDPHRGGRSGLWFDQMARVARWTIESGRTGIIGGKGLPLLKAELGYEVVPQWTVVRRLARYAA
jgi:hypothetical protein